MENTTSGAEQTAAAPARKRWEEPAIVLERSLEVSAQGGPPSGPPGAPRGYLGALGTSGDTGLC